MVTFKSEITHDSRPGVIPLAFLAICQLDDIELTERGAAAMLDMTEQELQQLRLDCKDFPDGHYTVGNISGFIEAHLNNLQP